jgi:hypothetical protein
MKTKLSVLITGAIIIVVLAILYVDVGKQTLTNTPETDTTVATTTDATNTLPVPPTGKIKADMFTGVLQSVDTGCFADGECSVTVDGKHVTLLVGRSQETVGSIVGAPSIGDLESYIGKSVEVYARDNSDGTYSLYGSEGFYVKVVGDTASTTLPNTITNTPTTTTDAACVVGGCSGQLCTDATEGPAVSNCMYSPEYACYKTAKCERQATGQCGWTETPALAACLAQPKTAEPTPQ